MKKEKNLNKKNAEPIAKIDPAILRESGVPNVYMGPLDSVETSLKNFPDMTSAQKKTLRKRENERVSQGFDSCEISGLYRYLAKYILPRLKVYKNKVKTDIFNYAYPYTGKEDIRNSYKWVDLLNRMIESFELIIERDNSVIWNEKPESERLFLDKKIKEGLTYFSEYFLDLFL